ncbi:MAG: MarR family transcriptional regulator [Bacillota bacterium]|jgi:DNA-binding MarR family transcriptional regulator|nr:MarR family transcriptional regulator [Eubacteriales bacterium]MDI9491388.1 MarR family transcriptional regulator [Bacillota bacterium]NLV69893.1 winged helix DNA-binding protein [Clostridiales bacterium]MDD3536689.1 MarR family transcriptional regulator [Eubacteriales bacterium]MDD4285807.1 MarR family transcriptional regulator [Eubacteriales bacterium]
MDSFNKELNDILVDTFKIITKIEEISIKRTGHDLSVSEVHILESAADDQGKGRTITDIAEDLRITLPSVTVAINKLVKKGYVTKARDEADGRKVYVKLTEKGMQMDRVHRYFHKKLVSNIAAGLREDEKEALYNAMMKMNGFFEKRLLKERP